MKKIITILCLIVLITLLIYKLDGVELLNNFNNRDSQNNQNISANNLDIDINIYNQLLIDILSSSDISQVSNHELLSEEVIDSINILYTNKKELENWNYDTSNTDSILELDEDVDSIQDNNSIKSDRYPIISIHGDIYGYGTEEKSIESYEIYNRQSLYEILYSEIYIDTIKIKIFNRETRSVQMYSIKLQDDGKVKEFSQII